MTTLFRTYTWLLWHSDQKPRLFCIRKLDRFTVRTSHVKGFSLIGSNIKSRRASVHKVNQHNSNRLCQTGSTCHIHLSLRWLHCFAAYCCLSTVVVLLVSLHGFAYHSLLLEYLHCHPLLCFASPGNRPRSILLRHLGLLRS